MSYLGISEVYIPLDTDQVGESVVFLSIIEYSIA